MTGAPVAVPGTTVFAVNVTCCLVTPDVQSSPAERGVRLRELTARCCGRGGGGESTRGAPASLRPGSKHLVRIPGPSAGSPHQPPPPTLSFNSVFLVGGQFWGLADLRALPLGSTPSPSLPGKDDQPVHCEGVWLLGRQGRPNGRGPNPRTNRVTLGQSSHTHTSMPIHTTHVHTNPQLPTHTTHTQTYKHTYKDTRVFPHPTHMNV